VRLVVVVTGASGAIYARRALHVLAALRAGTWPNEQARPDLEVDWVASATAPQVWQTELGEPMPTEVRAPGATTPGATTPGLRRWDRMDFGAPFASGSSAPDAVLVMPCSMSALSRVAHGGGDDLGARACEVALKERRRLVLVVRETPLSLVHLRNMVAATEAGAVVLPAVPSFYGAVRTLDDAIDTVVARALDHVGLRVALTRRWGAEEQR
jgi:polyprenyl P-hydroxybenzoate/phenylacrylic acid decarboxylase-like protein